MIRLTAPTTDLLSLITAQNGAKVVVGYSDATSSEYTGGSQATTVSSATTTTICDTPSSGSIRDIDFINIKNTYAGSHTITVQVSVSATLYPLVTVALASGDAINYTHGSGWCVLDSSGNQKVTVGSGGSGDVVGPASSTDSGFAKFDGTTGKLLKNSAAVIALADGGTNAVLADPGADRIMFWDDSAGAVTWLTAGTGLTITATTIDASGSATSNLIATPTTIAADTSYIVMSYLTITSTLTINGNLGIL